MSEIAETLADGVIRIPNIDTYKQEIIEGVLVLTPKKNYISAAEFLELNFANSIIHSCIIKDLDGELISNKTKYRPILIDIWKSIPAQKILQNTSFNIKLTDEKGLKGYVWCPEICMSIQSKCASETIIEIIKFIGLFKYKLEISIQLESGKIIYFKI